MRKVGIIGLGYAGLHTALAFGAIKPVVGYDINEDLIKELAKGHDRHGDFTSVDFKNAQVKFTSIEENIKFCDFYIVIVPTPVKKDHEPDFSYLVSASQLLARLLKKNDIVVFESTVYPGATEEICLPILESSGLKYLQDFNLGYSPERINPGDNQHSFKNTVKIVSGSSPQALEIIAEEYQSTVDRDVYRMPDIKSAEAVKIVENIQRDVNIALVNELAQIFHRLGINTHEVIKAAATKWNFTPYQPGFVGGHCIGIDPYYLIYKANQLGYKPKLITAGREVNEDVSNTICQTTIKHLIKNNLVQNPIRALILGVTYKENYDDIRNSKAIELAKELSSYGIQVFLHDPIADTKKLEEENQLSITPWDKIPEVSTIIIAVAHDQFKQLTVHDYGKKICKKGIIIDMKSIIHQEDYQNKDITIWTL